VSGVTLTLFFFLSVACSNLLTVIVDNCQHSTEMLHVRFFYFLLVFYVIIQLLAATCNKDVSFIHSFISELLLLSVACVYVTMYKTAAYVNGDTQ